MIKNTKYKIGFDIWGLITFIIIMIPNFIWLLNWNPKFLFAKLTSDSAYLLQD